MVRIGNSDHCFGKNYALACGGKQRLKCSSNVAIEICILLVLAIQFTQFLCTACVRDWITKSNRYLADKLEDSSANRQTERDLRNSVIRD